MPRSIKRTLRVGKLVAKGKKRREARSYQRKRPHALGKGTEYLTTFAYSDIDQRYGKKPRVHRYSGDIRDLGASTKVIRSPRSRRVRKGAYRTRPLDNLLSFFGVKKGR